MDDTHAGVEGEVGEGAELDKAGLILGNTVAYLHRRVNGGLRALERREVVELGERGRVPDPRKELLGRDDPGWHRVVRARSGCKVVQGLTVRLLLGPVEELVDHPDGRLGSGRARDRKLTT